MTPAAHVDGQPTPGTDAVLDELDSRIRKHITPVGFGGKKLLSEIRDQMDQMREVNKTLMKQRGERRV